MLGNKDVMSKTSLSAESIGKLSSGLDKSVTDWLRDIHKLLGEVFKPNKANGPGSG